MSGLEATVAQSFLQRGRRVVALHVVFTIRLTSALALTATMSGVPSLDHLIGGGQQRFWDSKAERLGGLQVDDELELGWPHDRQVGRFLAFEDAAGIDADLAKLIRDDDPVAHQPTGDRI